jgi:hypothetical protein
MRERPQKADGSLDGWLARCWRRRRLGRSGCLVGCWQGRRLGRAGCLLGSWRGRRLGHGKAPWVHKRPALPEAAARVKRR